MSPRPPTLVHRLEAFGARFLAASARALPRGAAFALGRAIGDGARRLGLRVDVARANLARAFPERTAGERESILRRAYTQAGMSAIELLRADPRDYAGRVKLVGVENIAAARRGGRGAVVVSGHFGAFELAVAAVTEAGQPVHMFVRAQSNPLVDALVVARRRRLGAGVVGHGRRGVGEALAILRQGGIVAVLADQDAGRDGVFVPFLGRPASTPPGPAEFALRAGASIVFGVAWRSDDGERYEVTLLPAIEPARSGDHAADVRALTAAHARALEHFVRLHPEQWLWTHRRWKTAPPDADAAPAQATAPRPLATLAAVLGLALVATTPGVRAQAPSPLTTRPAPADSALGAAESVFDGAGSSVFPLERARVRRIFEDIRIRRLPSGWAVDAEEWFEAGVAPTTAIMGLPDYRASLPAAERALPGRVAMPGTLRDLLVTVDGLPMALEEIPGGSTPGEDLGGIERIFRFAVPFSAEESRSVRLQYRFGESRTDGGEPLLFFYRNPGSLWEGESPKATMSVDLGDVSPEDLVVGWLRPLGYRLYGSRILWHRPAGEELADLALGIRPPGDPLAAFADRQKGPLALPLEAREEWIARLTARDLRFFTAWLAARRGGRVADSTLAATFAREPWYRPVPSYRESRLPADERRLLARLREKLLAWERARIPFRAGPPFVPDTASAPVPPVPAPGS